MSTSMETERVSLLYESIVYIRLKCMFSSVIVHLDVKFESHPAVSEQTGLVSTAMKSKSLLNTQFKELPGLSCLVPYNCP